MKNTINLMNVELGLRFRQERERLGLSQGALGLILDVTQRTVHEWEKGNTFPSALQLAQLAEKGFHISALFDGLLKENKSLCLLCKEVHFNKKSENFMQIALFEINSFFANRPDLTLLNVETLRDKKGDETGLRYYYNQQTIKSFNPVQLLVESNVDEHLETLKQNRKTNGPK